MTRIVYYVLKSDMVSIARLPLWGGSYHRGKPALSSDPGGVSASGPGLWMRTAWSQIISQPHIVRAPFTLTDPEFASFLCSDESTYFLFQKGVVRTQ